MTPDGKIYLAGLTHPLNNNAFIVRLNPNGTQDSTFADNSIWQHELQLGVQNILTTLKVLPGERILFAAATDDFYIERIATPASVPAITYNGSALTTTQVGQYQWYLNGTVIAGATSNTWNPTQNGDYRLMVTDPLGCSLWSNVLTVTNVGIDEMPNAWVAVYPNPASDFVVLTTQEHTVIALELVSINGKRIERFDVNGDTALKIDLRELTAGVYYVRVFSGHSVGIAKIVKL
jgi:hypothetical protein